MRLTVRFLPLCLQTVRLFREKLRNITIKLGYANAKLYKCPSCEPPDCFKSFNSAQPDATNCSKAEC